METSGLGVCFGRFRMCFAGQELKQDAGKEAPVCSVRHPHRSHPDKDHSNTHTAAGSIPPLILKKIS